MKLHLIYCLNWKQQFYSTLFNIVVALLWYISLNSNLLYFIITSLKQFFFFLMLLYGATLYSILYPLVCWSFGLSAWEIISSTNNHSPDYFLYLPFLRACCFCWILVTVVIKYVYFIIVFYFLYLLFWFLFIVLLVSHHIVILLGDSVHRWILIFIPFIKTKWPST